MPSRSSQHMRSSLMPKLYPWAAAHALGLAAARAPGCTPQRLGSGGIERIGARHRRREVIEEQALGTALKESPRLHEAFDGGFHRLLNQRPQEAVAAVREDDAQTPTPVGASQFPG
jgi:hypothetical protein